MNQLSELRCTRAVLVVSLLLGCLGRTAYAASPFVASPFAEEFVITGSERGVPGDHYIPSHGDGTFGPKSDIPGLGFVDGTDVADMDGDGDLDFVTCEGNTGNVYLYRNQGGGSFVPALIASGISTTFSTNLRIQDFNGDGRQDFVVGDSTNILGTKVFLQGLGGSFAVSDVLDTGWADLGLFGVAVGRLDGDGHRDIALLGYIGSGAGEVRLYSGDGAGAFGPPVLLFDVGDDFGVRLTTALAAFDLEGDGDLDLVAGGGYLSGEHYIYTNDGTGSFAPPASSAFTLPTQTGVDAFDADHDGDHDLVIAAYRRRLVDHQFYSVENLGGTLAPPVGVAYLSGDSVGVGAPPLVEEIRVSLDVKPGSCPKPLNTKSKGVLPVAILGTAGFDVTGIDPATLRLEGVPPLRWSVEDVGRPFAGRPAGCQDCVAAGPDGYLDLTLKFDTQAIVAALGPISDRQCRVARLTGNLSLFSGATPIVGEDMLTILKK